MVESPFNQKQVPSIPVVNSTEGGTLYILLLENTFTRKIFASAARTKCHFIAGRGHRKISRSKGKLKIPEF